MKKLLMLSAVVFGFVLSASGTGFWKAWQMDYGRPKAHIEEVNLAKKGKKYVGKKIAIRGKVKKIDLSEEGNPKVYLSHGTECRYGKMGGMAKALEVGKVAVISGFLEKGKDGKLYLSPAMTRDSSAPFNP